MMDLDSLALDFFSKYCTKILFCLNNNYFGVPLKFCIQSEGLICLTRLLQNSVSTFLDNISEFWSFMGEKCFTLKDVHYLFIQKSEKLAITLMFNRVELVKKYYSTPNEESVYY